ncbi:MAG: Arm DNA-binding domain-containing protein [Vulcanimicrobiaceae bacterium]
MSIYRRASGKWAVVISLERGSDGAQRRRAIGTFATKKEAEAAERRALDEKARGVDLAPGRVTVGEVFDRFCADRKSKGRAVRTVERYEDLGRLYLKPYIGVTPLSRLTPAHVSDLMVKLAERGSKAGKPLSAKSRKHALTALRTALCWAMKHELCVRNVAEVVDAPSVPRSQACAFDEAEIVRVLAEGDKGRWGSFFRLALAVGARRGELLALRWTTFGSRTAR